MKGLVTALAIAITLAGCSHQPVPSTPVPTPAPIQAWRPVVTINNDYGGFVSLYQKSVAEINSRGGSVRIIGDCRSSCTLYLGVNDVCVDRNATLFFHSAIETTTQPSVDGHRLLVDLLTGYYPPGVATWFRNKASHTTGKAIPLTGRELINLGVKECE